MTERLDDSYFTWLYSHVGSVKLRDRSKTYWSLLRQLHQKEFVWLVENDENRSEDGKDLRYEFLSCEDDYLGPESDDWLEEPCSMFEMLVALARKLSFEADGEIRFWFWRLMENVELDLYVDRIYDLGDSDREIDEILNRVIFRRYNYDGHGGLFPLEFAEKDQRLIEIWYQMSAYLIEQY